MSLRQVPESQDQLYFFFIIIIIYLFIYLHLCFLFGLWAYTGNLDLKPEPELTARWVGELGVCSMQPCKYEES